MTEEQAAIIVGRYATAQAKQEIQKNQHIENRQEKRDTTFKRHAAINNKPFYGNRRKFSPNFKGLQRGNNKQKRYFNTTAGPPMGTVNLKDVDSPMRSVPPSVASTSQQSVASTSQDPGSSSGSVATVPPDFTSVNQANPSGYIPLSDTTSGFPTDNVDHSNAGATGSQINNYVEETVFTGVGATNTVTYETQVEGQQEETQEYEEDEGMEEDGEEELQEEQAQAEANAQAVNGQEEAEQEYDDGMEE